MVAVMALHKSIDGFCCHGNPIAALLITEIQSYPQASFFSLFPISISGGAK